MADAATTSAFAFQAGIKKFSKVLLIGGGVFAGLLAVLLVVPHFVDLGLFKATYLPLIEDVLGRRVDVGEVHLRLVPTPSIQISKLRVADSQSIAGNTFFAAEQLQLKLKFLPLVRGRFEVTELVLDKPVFNLLKQTDGSFNYSDLAGKKNPAAGRREARKKSEGSGKSVEAAPLALPSRLRIRDGQMNLLHQWPNLGQYQGNRHIAARNLRRLAISVSRLVRLSRTQGCRARRPAGLPGRQSAVGAEE